jgi:hypothetical protein
LQPPVTDEDKEEEEGENSANKKQKTFLTNPQKAKSNKSINTNSSKA